MDELLTTLVTGAPNLIVAVAGLWWLSRLVYRLMDRIDDLCGSAQLEKPAAQLEDD